ncbi:ArsR/SmtB family transcription factor [Flavobacterium turcicum]|uniref:Winged helix-turn-helix transcriptional regulator n=1 Tax=Flavobacterium turcicum TaxID=2764718 RepID=A0ABR7JJG7_9FLAO|nr:metalloregulator ArsR/SmtB family transcription factor [Flavobacterium turcicum]MBC5864643.1 winged helix-turn-helix transcriptional regulator [Flavobacterium turcicum]NHL03386.1 winged helix-turn-helix transcriptional regulator [Flavobacterium turcicum]
MGTTKFEFYTEEQNELAVLAKAIGHPARIAIIEHLISVGSCVCGAIVNELSLAQPTVSQHLKELKNAGIIKGSLEGNAICYCLDEKGFAKLNTFFGKITTHLENKNNACC